MNKLTIRSTFIANDGTERTNTLDAYIRSDDSNFQLWINSGRRPDGSKVNAGIRLSKEQINELLQFMQCNIK